MSRPFFSIFVICVHTIFVIRACARCLDVYFAKLLVCAQPQCADAAAHPDPRAVENSCAAGAPPQLTLLPALLPRQLLGLVLGLVELEAGAALQLAPLLALLPRQLFGLFGLGVFGVIDRRPAPLAAADAAPLLLERRISGGCISGGRISGGCISGASLPVAALALAVAVAVAVALAAAAAAALTARLMALALCHWRRGRQPPLTARVLDGEVLEPIDVAAHLHAEGAVLPHAQHEGVVPARLHVVVLAAEHLVRVSSAVPQKRFGFGFGFGLGFGFGSGLGSGSGSGLGLG